MAQTLPPSKRYSWAQGTTFDAVTSVTVDEYEGSTVMRSTVMDYFTAYHIVESIYDGNTSSPRISRTDQLLTLNRQRIDIKMYPGSESVNFETAVQRYDNWGNLVYRWDYESHERYWSYANTNSTNKFVDSNMVQVVFFTNSFYSNSVNSNIHSALVGSAELQNGAGSPQIESYFNLDSAGRVTESKRLNVGWVIEKGEYDSHGNLVRQTDANNHSTSYVYNSTYSGAYLTAVNRTLIGTPNQYLVKRYGYDSSTGNLIIVVDEKGNFTTYGYDSVGRVLNVTFADTDGIRPAMIATYVDGVDSSSTILDENGNKIVSYFDGLGRLKEAERYNGSSGSPPDIIFSNGFEEGSFSAWSGTVGTPTLVGSPVHHGGYAMDSDSSGDYSYKYGQNAATIYARGYFRYDTQFTSNAYTRLMTATNMTYGDIVTVNVKNSAGSMVVRAYNFLTAAGFEAGFSFQPNTWYCVEFKLVVSPTVGEIRVWVDGEEMITWTGLNTGTSNIRGVKFGRYYSSGWTSSHLYTDCCAMDESYIGPEGSGYSLYSSETQAYNYLGLTSYAINAEGESYSFNYNALGQSRKTVNPDGSFREWIYDYRYNTVTELDEESRKKILNYDWVGRLTSVKEYLNQSSFYVSNYTYGKAGNLVKVRDGKGQETSYIYDQLNRQIITSYADGTREETGYDPAGNVRFKIDQKGVYTKYEYDSLDRLIKTSLYASTPFLSGWQYRRSIRINGTSAGAQANYQIKIRVNYGSGTDSVTPPNVYLANKSRTDFGDVRFTASDGSTLLDYWTSTKVDGSYAVFWVEVKNIPASPGSAAIYVYYGNSTASSIGSFDGTFVFGDPFDSSTLNTGRWPSVDGSPSYTIDPSSHWLQVTDMATDSWYTGKGFHSRTFNAPSGWMIEDAYGDANGLLLYMGTDSAAEINTGFISLHHGAYSLSDLAIGGTLIVDAWTATSEYIINGIVGGGTDYSSGNLAGSSRTLRTRIYKTGSNVKVDIDGVNRVNEGNSETASVFHLAIGRYMTYSFGAYRFGAFIVRNYASPEPAVGSFGSVESSGVAGWSHSIGFTVESGRVSTTLVCPIRLRLSTSSGITGTDLSSVFDELGGSYRKLTITMSDGSTEVGQIEVTRWDAANEEAELWFRANVSSTSDTQFYLCYDADHADNANVKDPGDATEIWPTATGEKYIGVYHMSEGSGVMVDSTSNNKDGTVGDLESRRVAGMSGGYAASFEPIDYISLGDLNLEINALTLLVAANPESVGQHGSLVGCWPSTDQLYLYARDQTPDRWRYMVYDSQGSMKDSGTGNTEMNVALGSWVTLTGTFERNGYFRTILDHAETYEAAQGNYGIRAPNPSGTVVSIGAVDNDGDGQVDDYGFNGQIDEVLIAGSAISPDLIDVLVYGLEDDLINWGVASSGSGGETTTYAYDEVGNRVSSSWNGTTVAWSYDARNRLLRETSTIMGVDYPVQYTYDDVGNVASIRYPDDTVLGYAYDDLNRVRAVGGYANLTYDRADRIKQVGYGNGVTGSYSYDNRGRPTQIRFTKGATLLNLTYAYDYSGSVTGITGSVSESYGYDQLDRLTSSSGAWGSLSYAYDAAGNMLSKGSTSYTYDNNMNRLSRVGASDDYAYDPNGNMVSRESGTTTWTYWYDVFNQLTSVRRNGTVQRLYMYDADGRRVRSYSGSSGNLRYVYSGLKVLYEAPDAGGSPRLRFYAGSLQIAEKTGSTVEYLHGDHLGSTRLKTNSTGGVIYSSSYQPFGVSQGESGSEEYRYTGKPEDDASGLYYYGARFYLPEIGRFITADTNLRALSDPQSLNRYIYCRDNPMKYIDPDGRFWNIVAGALAGGGINAAFYCFEVAATGKEWNWYEFGSTVVGGSISGGIAGATLGIGSGTLAFGYKTAVNILATPVVAVVQDEILKQDPGYASSLSETMSDALETRATSTAISIAIKAAESQNINPAVKNIAKIFAKSSLFFGPLATNTAMLFLSMAERVDKYCLDLTSIPSYSIPVGLNGEMN